MDFKFIIVSVIKKIILIDINIFDKYLFNVKNNMYNIYSCV